MNNCPKCGNPLQVGTSSCPICGTNIQVSATPEKTTEEKGKTTVTVASVASPVPAKPVAPAPAPAPAEAPVQPVPAVQTPEPVKAQPTPVVEKVEVKTESQVAAPTVAATIPKETAVAQAQPTEVAAQPTEVAAPAPVPTPTPTATPEPVDPNSIAPTIKPIESSTPVPSIPASLNDDAKVITTSVSNPGVKMEKPSKKVNKTVILVAGILAVVAICGALMMGMGGQKLNTNTNTNPEKNSALKLTSVSTNGFKFNLEEGWVITEDGTNVIVTNNDETVAVKLDYQKSGLDQISKSTIEGFFSTRTDFTNTAVTETTISAKKAYLVNTQINQAMVQVYYINGGTNLTLGATIVYQSNETKTKYEANVTELIGSLSYSDESLKAISSMEMYSNIFGVYNGVFNYQPTTEVPQTPDQSEVVEENPETPVENQETPVE